MRIWKGIIMPRSASVISLAVLLVTVSVQQGVIRPKKGELMYKKVTTNIMVDNVNETLGFYERVLGFAMVMAVPEDSQDAVTERDASTPLGFALVTCDEVQLMFQSRKSLAAELPQFADCPLGGSITLYVEVADTRELYEKIKDKVTILKDLHTTFYGMQEFCVRDCNGYVLTFASRQ